MATAKTELLAGTLDLLVLRVLNSGPLHGFGIGERIHAVSNEVLDVEEGSLYPSLYRMEAKGWIKAEWGQSDRGRKAKLYSLTRVGRRQLENERELWSRMAVAIGSVLKNA
jgi:transcriptional regulator